MPTNPRVGVFALLDRVVSLSSLRDRVARLDDVGVTGVLVPDHLFVSLGLGRAVPLRDDRARRRATTVEDLVASARRVRAVASSTGRPPPRFSILIDSIAFGAVPDSRLEQCPYVLAADPGRMRDVLAELIERIGLRAVVLQESSDLVRLCAEVVA